MQEAPLAGVDASARDRWSGCIPRHSAVDVVKAFKVFMASEAKTLRPSRSAAAVGRDLSYAVHHIVGTANLEVVQTPRVLRHSRQLPYRMADREARTSRNLVEVRSSATAPSQEYQTLATLRHSIFREIEHIPSDFVPDAP